MENILKQLGEIHRSLVQKETAASQLLAAVEARDAEVKIREARNSDYESAMAVLQAAEARRKDADAELARLGEERVKFNNLMSEERRAIKAEEARLLPLQDQEKQLAKDRQALYDREQALEVEKREFKTRYIEKIKAHFKNTGGAPDPDAIT